MRLIAIAVSVILLTACAVKEKVVCNPVNYWNVALLATANGHPLCRPEGFVALEAFLAIGGGSNGSLQLLDGTYSNVGTSDSYEFSDDACHLKWKTVTPATGVDPANHYLYTFIRDYQFVSSTSLTGSYAETMTGVYNGNPINCYQLWDAFGIPADPFN